MRKADKSFPGQMMGVLLPLIAASSRRPDTRRVRGYRDTADPDCHGAATAYPSYGQLKELYLRSGTFLPALR